MVSGIHKKQNFEFMIGSPLRDFRLSNIWIHREQNYADFDWIRDHGTGIRGLKIFVEGRDGHDEQALGSEGIATTISLKW